MTFASVSSAASDTLILAVDTAREGFTITNTDANALYVKMDSSAATTASFSVKLTTDQSFGISGYVGEIRGIWAADGSGAALVTSW